MDHLPVAPRPDPAPRPGALARMRAHVVDFTPLKISAQFRRLFVGKSISDFGDEIIAVVLPYQVFQITGSPLAVGMLGLAQLIPVFVFPIVGGTVADAVERRKLVTVTHCILAVMSALMAVNAALPHPLLWPMYVFTFLASGLYTFNRPALDTWPARLLERDLLPSSNALDAGFGTFAGMLGPVAAGFLLASIQPAGVYVFDVCTFLAVIVAARMMRPSPPADDENEVSWEAVKDGFRFLRGKRNVQSVFLADLNAMIFGFPMALFPAVALRLDPARQAQVLGFLYAAPAAGAFVATLLSGRAKHVRRQGRAIMLAIVVWGAAIVVFGFAHALWLALILLAIAGGSDLVSAVFRQTMLLELTPDELREDNVTTREALIDDFSEDAGERYAEKEEELGAELMRELERFVILQVVDVRWREHLENMDYLREGVGLRSMAQKDPLVEYTAEGERMFTELGRAIRGEVVLHLFHAELAPEEAQVLQQPQSQTTNGRLQYEHETTAGAAAIAAAGSGQAVMEGMPSAAGVQTVYASEHDKIGRNDPCWCGSGKKFKKCHGA
jgi:MFS family permease